MRRIGLALLLMLSAPSQSYAQTHAGEPVLLTAIESVCRPFVIDGVDEAEISALQGTALTYGRYNLGPDVRVGLSGSGAIRICSLGIEGDAIEASRALIFDAATRWPVALDYRGDRSPGTGFVRKEVFCPSLDGPQTTWIVLSRESGTRLALGIIGSTAPTRDCADS